MNKTHWIILAIIIILLAIWGLTRDSGPEAQGEPIRVGIIIPTGLYAETGENALRGYQLAMKEINESGGINGRKIEIDVQTYETNNNASALSAYNNLNLKNIDLILGPQDSNAGLTIAPQACENSSLLFASSIGAKNFASTCDTLLNIWPVDYNNSKSLGKLAVDQGYKRIAVVGSVQPWEFEQSNGVIEGIEESSGNLVYFLKTTNQSSDYIPESTKVLNSNPDAIFLTNYGYMHVMARRLREMGSEAQFFVIIIDETRKENALGAFENVIAISSFTPTDEFIKKFENEYGVKPDFPADTSYDTLKILVDTISKTDSTEPSILAENIISVGKYSGSSGKFTFTETGDVIKQPILQTVINNKIVEYKNE